MRASVCVYVWLVLDYRVTGNSVEPLHENHLKNYCNAKMIQYNFALLSPQFFNKIDSTVQTWKIMGIGQFFNIWTSNMFATTLIVRTKTTWHTHRFSTTPLHSHAALIASTHKRITKHTSSAWNVSACQFEGSTRLKSIKYTHIFISDISYFVHTTFSIYFFICLCRNNSAKNLVGLRRTP